MGQRVTFKGRVLLVVIRNLEFWTFITLFYIADRRNSPAGSLQRDVE